MVMNAPEREDDRNNSLNKVYMQPLPLQHQEVAERFGIDVVTAWLWPDRERRPAVGDH